MLSGLSHSDVDVNDLVGKNVLIDGSWIEEETGLNPYMLSIAQLNELRARLLCKLAQRSDERFIKTHSANVKLASGPSLGGSSRAVVIVRHPFDVAVSYAKFVGESIESIVETLGRSQALIGAAGGSVLVELMGSWSEHLVSWIDEPAGPRLLVRYEDMRADPHGVLRSILEFLDVEASDEQVERAVVGASFDRLKAKEDRDGFAAKPVGGGRMFREGRTGEGREALDEELQDRIVESCGAAMKQLGYRADGGIDAPLLGCA